MSTALSKKIDDIKAQAGIRSSEVAELLDTTPQTVSRWQSGKVEPRGEKLKELLTLAWLAQQLSEFYKADEARLWLFTPHRLLGGQSPADRIKVGKLDDVLAIIDQLRDGAYV